MITNGDVHSTYLENVWRTGEFWRRFLHLVVRRAQFHERLVLVETARQVLEYVLRYVDERDLGQLTQRARQPATTQ